MKPIMKPCQTKKQPVQRGSGSKKFKRPLIPTYLMLKLKKSNTWDLNSTMICLQTI
jgi:hypothetical protein